MLVMQKASASTDIREAMTSCLRSNMAVLSVTEGGMCPD